jgi:hypothetical protein
VAETTIGSNGRKPDSDTDLRKMLARLQANASEHERERERKDAVNDERWRIVYAGAALLFATLATAIWDSIKHLLGW